MSLLSDPHLAIALVAAIVNLILTLSVPIILKPVQLPIINQIKKSYECNKHWLFVTFFLVLFFVYVSLKVTPFFQEHIFTALANLGKKEL